MSFVNNRTSANTVTVVPADVPARPLPAPERVTRFQNAAITGPAGEEIHTDAHGRSIVQFPWDRRGKHNERSSKWLRSNQAWAGPGWGALFLPRIGQEVLVDFIEGNPDRPLITGRLYHGTNRSAYKLPDHKTRSTVQTRSSKGGDGYNEIRFEDLAEQQELYVQAEKDLHSHIKNHSREDVVRDRHRVTAQDRRVDIGKTAQNEIDRHCRTRVAGSRLRAVAGNGSEQVRGRLSERTGRSVARAISGGDYCQVREQYYLKAASLVFAADRAVTVKTPTSFVKVDATGVYAGGAGVNLNSGGAPGRSTPLKSGMPSLPLTAIAVGVAGNLLGKSATQPPVRPATALALSAPLKKPGADTAAKAANTVPEQRPAEQVELVDMIYVPSHDRIYALTAEEQKQIIAEEQLFQQELTALVRAAKAATRHSSTQPSRRW